jgi:two-component system OmpR family response regulator
MVTVYEATTKKDLDNYLRELLDTKFYQIGAYTFDVNKRLLTLKDETVKLSKKESYVLIYFAANINKSLSRKDLVSVIWREYNLLNSRSMDVYLCKIRKLLSKDPNILFVNLHGKGFRMVVDKID